MLVLGCERHVTLYPGEDNVSRQYIFFNADVTDTKGNVVQGTSLSADPGTDFGVFGYRYHGAPIFSTYKAGTTVSQGHASAFDNVARVYRPSGSSIENPLAFIYDGLALWHSDSHTFYAYYPYDNPKSSIVDVPLDAENFSANPYISYTQPTELSQMVDVMTAKKTAVSADGEVELHFEHRLFAFEVVLVNSQTDSRREIEVTESSIEFTGLNSQATMYFKDGDDADTELDFVATTPMTSPLVHNYGRFTVPGITGSTPVQYNMNEKVISGTTVSNSFLFIPCSTLRVKLTLKIKTAWDEIMVYTYDHSALETALAPEGGFKAGHKYSIIVTKTEEGIDFKWEWQNTNGDWTNGPDSSFDFN